MRSTAKRTLAMTALSVALFLVVGWQSTAVLAQEPEAAPPEPVLPALDDEPDTNVDDILKDESAMLAGEGYFYDPGDRRDPFKSLLEARDSPLIRGPRPEGIPGLLIDEIDITGIFVTGDGPIIQVQSSDREQSFLLRVGDQLYDGDVIGISGKEAIFKQIVDDPTALKPFREVVKKLNP
ncbi:MAG: hypothetical protein GWO83_01000 [Bacteroidia bacterium]|nr:hypothetical protein [Bacteroidia bacterium]